MGKGNRARLKRESENLANAELKAKNAKKQANKGVPLWAGNMILAAIGLLLVVVIVVTTVSSSGIVLKITKYASTTSYTLNGTQMTYIFRTLYNNFASQYSSYLTYILDSSKSLKDQKSLYSDEDGNVLTWFEYFASQTEAEAEQLLVLCEMAKSEGLDKLSEEEETEIENALKTLEETALQNGYSYKGFIKAMYGAGVSEKDIVTVMTYQTIASNYYDIIKDRLGDKITEDRVNAYFDEHKKDFLKVDYVTYSFSASLSAPSATATAEEKQAAQDEYDAKKKIIDEYFGKLEATKTAEEFKNVVIDYLMASSSEDSFEKLYDEAFEDMDEGKRPSDEDKKTFKDETLKNLKEELLKIDIFNEKEEEETEEEDNKDDSEKQEEEDKKSEIDKAKESVRDDILEEFTAMLDKVSYKKVSYIEENEESEWFFKDETAVNAVKANNSKEETDEETGSKSYTGSVYMLTKKPYKDESKTHDVGHILVQVASGASSSVKEEANKKANEILKEYMKGEKTKDTFEALAKKNTDDSGVFYENVKEGDMVEEFENWLFDEKRQVGDVEIVETEYGYHVMYYVGKGMDVWYSDVFNAIYEEDYADWMEQAKKDTNVVINQKNINKISA